MNIFKKAYCRIFQTAFHWALPFLPYREPKILRSITELPDQLNALSVSSVLLVTDAGIKNAGITAPLEALLKERKIQCAVYDKTRANPTVENVEEARKLYISEKCECLIAFGGGSSITWQRRLARVSLTLKRVWAN